jgi:hypothetical protein
MRGGSPHHQIEWRVTVGTEGRGLEMLQGKQLMNPANWLVFGPVKETKKLKQFLAFPTEP